MSNTTQGVRPPGRDQRPVHVPPDRAPVLAEALAYLGSAIVLAGALLLLAEFWQDLSVTLRMGLIATVDATLLVSGLLVPARLGAAGGRLRSVVWFGASATTAAFLALLGSEALDLSAADTAVLTTTGTLGAATLLWVAHRAPLQQIAMMVSAMAVAVTLIADLVAVEGLPGLGVWAVGTCWMLLGWADLLRPARMAMALGAATLVIGAQLTMTYDAGVVFAVISVVAVVGVGLLSHDLIVLAIAALASIQVLPMAVIRWFPGALAGPLALLAAGALVVLLAIVTFRRGAPSARHRRSGHQIQPPTALAACSVVLLCCLAVVGAAAIV